MFETLTAASSRCAERTGVPAGLFVGIVAVVLWMNPAAAGACSCAPTLLPQIALKRSDAVFSGLARAREYDRGSHTVTYTFTVDRAWKGVSETTVLVETSAGVTSCGAHFELGSEYLVYASAVSGSPRRPPSAPGVAILTTSSCSRSSRLGRAARIDIPSLGDPTWINDSYRPGR